MLGFDTHQLIVAAAIFVVTLLLSSALVIALIVLLPEDHFAPLAQQRPRASGRRWRWFVGRVAKNLLGLLLVVIGVVLALPGVPGQGLLTVLAGLLLIDLPAKRRLERALLGRRAVRRAVDRLRGRFGRPPLLGLEPAGGGSVPSLPEDADPPGH